MKYKQVYPGEWQQPVRKGYRMKCCKRGLVHILDFRLIRYGKKHVIQLRAKRG